MLNLGQLAMRIVGDDRPLRSTLSRLPSAARQAGQRAGTGLTRGASAGLKAATRQVDAARVSFDRAGEASARFGGLTGVVLKAAGVAAVGYGLKVAAGNEQAEISFTTMLGSAQKADVFLKQLQKFAATTPFEFPELQTAASSLISAGVNAAKVIPIMRTLGDVTAGMGTGSEGIKRATIALQQMNAAGRITAEDLNQLRDAGIPVFDLLAAATGKTKTEVAGLAAAGKLGRKELEALMAAMESGKGLERFAGLMDQQSKSLAGMISTLRDDFGQGLAGSLRTVFPLLKASIGAWNDLGSGTKTTLAVIAGSTIAFGTAAGGAVKLAGALRTLGLSASAARIAVGGVGAALGIASLAFGVYATQHAKAEQKVDDFTQALQGETDAIQENVRTVAAKQLQDAGALRAAEQLGLSLNIVTDAALGQQDAINETNRVIDAYIAAGLNSADVDVLQRAEAANILADAVRGTGGAYNRAMTEARQMSAATADGQAAMGGMEKKTIDAREALQQWRAELFKAARASIDLQGSQDAVEEAVDDATQAVKDNGKTLNSNTEKGRANRAALRNLASSSVAYREKLIEQGAKQNKVTEATERGRREFIRTAVKMGATRKEAKELADKFGLLDRKIDSVDGQKVVIKFKADTSWKDSSGVKWSVNLTSPSSAGRLASGGQIRGHSTSSRSDNIPVWATAGEFMQPVATVKHYGPEAMEALRQRRIPKDALHLASGGYLNLDLHRSGLRPGNTVPGNMERLRDKYASEFGERIGKQMAKAISPDLGGLGGSAWKGGKFLSGVKPAPGSGRRHSGYSWARWAGDFPNPYGTPVHAWKPGVVRSVLYWNRSYGHHVRINHPGGQSSLYAHMSTIAVRRGQRVRAGQTIGRVGSTGNSTGPHLHFEAKGGIGRGAHRDTVPYQEATMGRGGVAVQQTNHFPTVMDPRTAAEAAGGRLLAVLRAGSY